MDIPAGFAGVFPFNLRVGNRRLRTTKAQLLCFLRGVPVLYTREGQTPVLNFDGPAPAVLLLQEEEAENAWLAGDQLAVTDGCVWQGKNGLTVSSTSPETVLRLLPEGKEIKLSRKKVEIPVSFRETERTKDYAAFLVQIGEVPAGRVEDVLLNIAFTGDHADVFADGQLIADWYTTGQPWKMALKRHGYPRELEIRVYPVTKPVYFEIPEPQGMSLDQVSAEPVYRFAVEKRVKGRKSPFTPFAYHVSRSQEKSGIFIKECPNRRMLTPHPPIQFPLHTAPAEHHTPPRPHPGWPAGPLRGSTRHRFHSHG